MEKQTQIEDKRISQAIMASFVLLTIQYFLLVYLGLTGTSRGAQLQLVSKAIVGLIYLRAFPIVFKREKFRFVFVYWIAIVTFLIHFFIFPENRTAMIAIFPDIFFMSLPTFVYAVSLNELSVFKNSMVFAGKIVLLFGTLIALLSFFGRIYVGRYSMSLSYYMLLPALLYLERVIDRFDITSVFLFALCVGVILAMGARGPILCVGVFFILKMLKPNAPLTKLRLILYSLVTITGAALVVSLDKILLLLDNFLSSYGITSRTLRLFLQGGVYMSGRDRIYNLIWQHIVDKPLLGIGLAGDRIILAGSNAYVHNFFLEVLGNFGIIVGALVLLCFIFNIIKPFSRNHKDEFALYAILFSLGFVHLFVSGSYLTDIKFWLFLGVVWNINVKNKSRNSTVLIP